MEANRYSSFNILAALCLILLSALFNEWSIAAVLYSDGTIDSQIVVAAIRLLDASLLAAATVLLWRRKRIRPLRYLLPTLVMVLLILPLLEVFAYVSPSGRVHLGGLPDARERLLSEEYDDQDRAFLSELAHAESDMRYSEYYLYSRESRVGNPDDAAFRSSRLNPDSVPADQADIRIWTFGGSTMIERRTPDALTISNTIARVLNREGMRANVMNFGTPAFHSTLESIKFQELLRRVRREEWPDLVIFYDGYNDAGNALRYGAGKMQRDLSKKFEALVKKKHGTLFAHSLNTFMSNNSFFWQKFIEQRLYYLIFEDDLGIYTSDENVLEAADIYENNITMIRGICHSLGIDSLFVLQPMIHTKKNKTEFEWRVSDSIDKRSKAFIGKYYETTRNRLRYFDGFHDMSHILDTSTRSDFIDQGHTGPLSSPVIGEALAQLILRNLERSYASSAGVIQ